MEAVEHIQLFLLMKETEPSNRKVYTSDWWSNGCRGPVVSMGEIGWGPEGLRGKRKSCL